MLAMFGSTRYVVGIYAAAAMMAGCGGAQAPSGSQTPFAPQSVLGALGPLPLASPLIVHRNGPKRRGWLSPEAKTPGAQLLYVSDEGASDVLIYPEAGKLRSPIGTISTGVNLPWGLYVDKRRTLYVANQYINTVTAYPSGSTSPRHSYSEDLSRPLYPVVDRYGDLFVSNANNGTVVEYVGKSTSAYRVLQTPGAEADGMDFDEQGNLYVAYRNGISGSIEEFAPGSSQGTILGMKLDQPQGLIVDDSGNILVVESGMSRIDLFPPGHLKPAVEVPVSGANQLAIQQTENRLFVAAENGIVYECRYPFPPTESCPYVKDEPKALIQGVALSNGQTF
jgi:hypothetical protein